MEGCWFLQIVPEDRSSAWILFSGLNWKFQWSSKHLKIDYLFLKWNVCCKKCARARKQSWDAEICGEDCEMLSLKGMELLQWHNYRQLIFLLFPGYYEEDLREWNDAITSCVAGCRNGKWWNVRQRRRRKRIFISLQPTAKQNIFSLIG